jgi:hypothetical protein
MTRLSFAAIFGFVAAIAAPALARDTARITTARSSLHYDARTQRYCAARTVTGADTITGSVLPRRTCRTREQWAAMGVLIPQG